MLVRFVLDSSPLPWQSQLVRAAPILRPLPNTTPATLDQALAELSIPAITSASGVFFDAGADAPALLPSRCPDSATAQSFVCTPFSASGVTFNQAFTLLTASGAKQSAFDATTTAAVRVNTTVAGTVADAGTSLTVDGQQELTLSGLVTGLHTLNGASSLTLAGTIADGTTSFPIDVTVTTSIANLVLPANTDAWNADLADLGHRHRPGVGERSPACPPGRRSSR